MKQSARKSFLNAGSGSAGSLGVPAIFAPGQWAEVRLDLDPHNAPDIVGSFVDMQGVVGDDRFDALFCSHALEHLHAHEIIPALREFRRVLKADGFALITCPDLAAICRFLLERGAEEIAYHSPAGPIRPIDMLFGHGKSIAEGRFAMAHKTGFTAQRMARTALAAGFSEVRVIEGASFDIWAVLLAPAASLEEVKTLFDSSELWQMFASDPVSASSAAEPANIFR